MFTDSLMRLAIHQIRDHVHGDAVHVGKRVADCPGAVAISQESGEYFLCEICNVVGSPAQAAQDECMQRWPITLQRFSGVGICFVRVGLGVG